MADRQHRVIAALNFIMGKVIDYHSNGCDHGTLVLNDYFSAPKSLVLNDYFSAPKSNKESRSSDSEGLALSFDFLNHKTTL